LEISIVDRQRNIFDCLLVPPSNESQYIDA